MRKEPFKHLIPGRQYTIAQAFVDYYGTTYSVGETYTFLGNNFLPYEDGLTLHFAHAFEQVSIYLQWRGETQAAIIDNLEIYFIPVGES
jgi:hypothetical protein